MIRLRPHVRLIGVLVAVASIVALSGCTAPPARVATTKPKASFVLLGATAYPAVLPTAQRPSDPDIGIVYPLAAVSGFSGPVTIAADPGRGGVWFVAFPTGVGAPALFYFNPASGTLDGWSLPPTLVAGANQGLVVDSSGIVWAGNGSSLFRLDPTSGSVSVVAVPTPSDSQAEESYRPSDVRGTHQISELAASPSGDIAISMTAASSVLIYDPATATFSQIQAPGDVSVTDVAYLDDGTLGVGLASWGSSAGPNEVWLRSPDGTDTVVAAPSLTVTSSGHNFVVSASLVNLVASSGLVTPVSGLGSDSGSNIEAVETPSGAIVGATPTGLSVVAPSTGTSRTMRLGQYGCPISGAGEFASTGSTVPVTSGAGQCAVQANSLTMGSDGIVWFVASGAGTLLVPRRETLTG